MRRILPLFLLLCAFQLSGQQLPLYTQYVFNPYMLNPSMVAFSSRPEINMLYRQQWSNISDGPRTIQLDGQYNQDRTVLLSSTMAMITYGYRVHLAEDHTIGFGLSAGMYQNRIRSEDAAPVDQGDPALLTSVNNNMAVDGQFGVHYRTKGFVFAYSLVNLFDHKFVSAESFQKPKFSQLKNQILFASYRFNVIPGKLSLQPNAAYRLTENNLNYFEGSMIASIMNVVDVGGGYRQNFGPTAMVRVSVGPLQAGFAYDFPSNTGLISPGGTKEIQVKFRFGKPEVEVPQPGKKSRRAQDTESIVQTPAPAQAESIKPKQEEKQEVIEEVKKEEVRKEEAPKVEEKKIEEKKEEPILVSYYYIIK
jgi:type IX secretion system PorP/SprF family membrane protein